MHRQFPVSGSGSTYLHPALMRVLLAKVTPQTVPNVGRTFGKVLGNIAAGQAAAMMGARQSG